MHNGALPREGAAPEGWHGRRSVCRVCQLERSSRGSARRRSRSCTRACAAGSAAMRSAALRHGVHDGRVVAAAEALADRGEGRVGVLAGEVHGDLARPGDAALRAAESSSSRVTPKAAQVSSWTRSIDGGSTRRARARARDRGRRGPRRRARRRSAGPVSEWKATTRIRAPSSARTLAVMRSAIASSAPVVGQLERVVLDALAQDRQARGEVGRLEVGDEAGLEALAQAVLERGHVGGQAVGREHELAAGLVQRVERVEELLLGLRLALEELDVVDEQDVGAAEARLEVLGALRLDRGDELVREALGGRVADAQPVAVRAT